MAPAMTVRASGGGSGSVVRWAPDHAFAQMNLGVVVIGNHVMVALCTLIRTLKPAGIRRIGPEPTVATVLSRTPPEDRRDSGMRYQISP
jgi:hypothetical protein